MNHYVAIVILAVFAATADGLWAGTPSTGPASRVEVIFEKKLDEQRTLIATSDPIVQIVRDTGTGLTGSCVLHLVDARTGSKARLWTELQYERSVRVLDAEAAHGYWVAVFAHGGATSLRAGLVPASGQGSRPNTDASDGRHNLAYVVPGRDQASVQLYAEATVGRIRRLADEPVFLVELELPEGRMARYACIFEGTGQGTKPSWWQRTPQAEGE